ncbi:MAG: glycosyl hydrolase [Liquorilactobacillus ghanensis]|uniref:glycosyl hydrolase n=1 Tax=Liquorilactobacillus ghanensis TaxID=399370 RepID=UPI0039ED956B
MNKTSFIIDGKKLDLNAMNANTFKGFGYISCNNSSRLLLDYKWEYPESYQQILTILFGGTHPLMRMLKVEMGIDANTSSGTEPATMRTADEAANVCRGAGFQLIADARQLQPTLKTAILRWGEPGFLRKLWANVKTDNPDQDVLEAAYEPMYQWYKKTIIAAYETYGYLIDYVDPDRNETKHPMYRWIKWFANRLRADKSEFPEGFPVEKYNDIKLIAADQNYERDFGDQMVADQDLRVKVPAVGFHYNTDDSSTQSFTKLADEYQHEVWYSEGIAPMTNGKYRVHASNGEGIGGTQSGLDIANRLIKSYVKSRRSLYLFQPAVSAYYPGVNYSHKELISASRPWSGFFEVDNVGLQCMKHFSDFAKAGWDDEGAWRYLTSACDSGVGGTENLDHNQEAPSYLTLMAPDKQNYSVIFVNDSAEPRMYHITIQNLAVNQSQPLDVWESIGPKSVEDGYDSRMKRIRETIQPIDGKADILVYPHSIVTATTLRLRNDQEVVYHRLAAPCTDKVLKGTGDMLYMDDFSYAHYSSDYLMSRGGTPRYMTDQGGAFEVVRENDRNFLQQMISEKQRALDWEYSYAPNLTFGDDHWTDYAVMVSVKFDNHTQQNSPTGNYFGIGLRELTDVKGRLESAPYVFKIFSDGSCQLIKEDQIVKLTYIDNFDLSIDHQLIFQAEGNHLTVSVDNQHIIDFVDTGNPHFSGRVKLGSGYFHTRIKRIEVKRVNRDTALISERLDDLDDRLVYTGNWLHVCGLDNTKWNRTLSYGTADAEKTPVLSFCFVGTGFSLIGKQNTTSSLQITINHQVINWNYHPQSGSDRSENTRIIGLLAGKHQVTVMVTDGKFTLDAIEFIE